MNLFNFGTFAPRQRVIGQRFISSYLVDEDERVIFLARNNRKASREHRGYDADRLHEVAVLVDRILTARGC
jgi:hypothetical protein